jgi:hypothetical protein
MLRSREAFRQGLPLNFYQGKDTPVEIDCQKWPNDYTFILLLQFMYEQMQSSEQPIPAEVEIKP